MHRLVPELVKQMGAAYPELGQQQKMIEDTLLGEEVKFKQTLDRGLKLLDDEVAGLGKGAALPGASAFKLYDTYGFPLDLTQDALRERGMTVDQDGFDTAMADQKAKARAAWSGAGGEADASVWFDVADKHGTTDFLGYETLEAEAQIVALIVDSDRAETATGAVQIACNQSPFYAESGGQVGDAGTLVTETGTVRIDDTRKVAGVFIHIGEVTDGQVKTGQGAQLRVDAARRADIQANHSATHLLNEALRAALGDHVVQRGSLNAPDRLRFDFSHNAALGPEDLGRIEREVNTLIRQNGAVSTRIMATDDARDLGAQALFGEKYGDEVRVVSMGQRDASGKGKDGQTYSIELCGGTHVKRLGEIGAFVALGDSASSSGVRRIEALTGQAALDYLREQDRRLTTAAGVLKVSPGEVAARVKALLDDRKTLTNEVAQLRREVAMGGGAGQAFGPEEVNGLKLHAQVMQGVTGKDLPGLIDEIKTQIGSGVVLLIADTGGKAAVATGVTRDLEGRLSAVDLLRAVVPELGGKGGGGRADLAQGGAPSAENAPAALAKAKTYLEEL